MPDIEIVVDFKDKAKWDSLSPDIQKVFDDMSPIGKEAQKKGSDTATQGAMDTCKQKGVEMVIPTAEEMARWAKAAPEIETNWAKDADSKGLPGTQIVTEIKQILSK